MSEEIFRQKSIDKIKSPDNLNEYIRVSSPGIWLLLICIIALLAGACIWGVFGHIDHTVSAAVYVDDGGITCYLDESGIAEAEVGMTVKFAECEGVIVGIGSKDENGYACIVQADSTVENGIYVGELIVNHIKPMSLILN